MHGTYDPWLVGLSIGVAIIAAYVALDFVGRLAAARRTKLARYWLAGGAASIGVGIWSMHFIGMLAFRLPMPMAYDTAETLFSLAIAVVVSGFALYTASTGALDNKRLLRAGTCMGLGIAAMHYAGMDAMEIEPAVRYDPALVGLSIAIALSASVAALWVTFEVRVRAPIATPKRVVSAVVMGVAIAGIHYTAMAAASFEPGSFLSAEPTDIGDASLALVVGAFSSLVLLSALLASIVDARLTDRSSRMVEATRRANAALEERTQELTRANELLREEAREREKTKAALRESEARYRLFTSLSADWSWEQDAELRFIDLPEREVYCGVTRAKHIGKRRWEIPNSEPVNTTWEEHKAVARRPQGVSQPRHKTARRRWNRALCDRQRQPPCSTPRVVSRAIAAWARTSRSGSLRKSGSAPPSTRPRSASPTSRSITAIFW